MAKGCALSTGYLPRGGLPRNSVDRITDRPDMSSAVDRGRKASFQTNPSIIELCHETACFGGWRLIYPFCWLMVLHISHTSRRLSG